MCLTLITTLEPGPGKWLTWRPIDSPYPRWHQLSITLQFRRWLTWPFAGLWGQTQLRCVQEFSGPVIDRRHRVSLCSPSASGSYDSTVLCFSVLSQVFRKGINNTGVPSVLASFCLYVLGLSVQGMVLLTVSWSLLYQWIFKTSPTDTHPDQSDLGSSSVGDFLLRWLQALSDRQLRQYNEGYTVYCRKYFLDTLHPRCYNFDLANYWKHGDIKILACLGDKNRVKGLFFFKECCSKFVCWQELFMKGRRKRHFMRKHVLRVARSLKAGREVKTCGGGEATSQEAFGTIFGNSEMVEYF